MPSSPSECCWCCCSAGAAPPPPSTEVEWLRALSFECLEGGEGRAGQGVGALLRARGVARDERV